MQLIGRLVSIIALALYDSCVARPVRRISVLKTRKGQIFTLANCSLATYSMHTSLSLFISSDVKYKNACFSIKQQLSANEMILLYGENADNQCNGSYSYADDESICIPCLLTMFDKQRLC